MVTSLGTMRFALTPERTPITVANFLAYVDEGFFDGLVFHRVIRHFMVQGGGFDADLRPRAATNDRPPVALERGGVSNARGTIQGRKRARNSQLQGLVSRSFSTRFG